MYVRLVIVVRGESTGPRDWSSALRQRSSTGLTDARFPRLVSLAMELQPIAEESAKAAATSQSAAAAEAESLRRKVVIACGKRSESEDSDTAMLLAFATKRVLRREDSEATSPAPSSAGDLISVVHVSELPPLVLCALCDRAQTKHKSHVSARAASQGERRTQACHVVHARVRLAGVDAHPAEGLA